MGVLASLGLKGWLNIALGLALLWTWSGWSRAENLALRLTVKLTETTAALNMQNSAVDELKANDDRKAAASARELAEARKASAASLDLAKRIEARRPLSGKCLTPPEVLGAEL